MLVFVTSSIFLLGSCNEDEDTFVQFLKNSDVETGSTTPESWWYYTGFDKYDVVWTDEESFSATKSLHISTDTIESTDFAFWAQTLNTDIPHGQSVTLRAWVKGNLTGTGISIVIRGDDTDGVMYQFVSTEGNTSISGTFDWSEYSITLDNIDSRIQILKVYLVYLPNTTGEVYFDDIFLVN